MVRTLRKERDNLLDAEKRSTSVEKPLSKDLTSHGSQQNPFWDFWGPIFFTLAIYFGVRTYLVEARYIPSGSMLPGLQINDRLLIEKLTFRMRSPRRGEIVVFNSPYSFHPERKPSELPSSFQCGLLSLPLLNSISGLGHPACDAYIKRVIGVPGDKVTINVKGEVFVNGKREDEPYVSGTNYCNLNDVFFKSCPPMDVFVPQGHFLVLGDNRRNSMDSRFWSGGPFLPGKQIIGRAIWRFLPLDRIGTLKP